jgi:hypothetical protein
MTTLRGVLKKLFGQSDASEMVDETQRVSYSYRVFWTRQARTWNADQRRTIRERLNTLMPDAEFETNDFERVYHIEGVDGEHAGASVLALAQVLEALDAAD